MAAFTTEAAVKVKQKVLAEIRKAHVQGFLKTLFSYLAQHKGNPDLGFINIGTVTSASTYTTALTGTLYGLILKNLDSTAAYVKVDHTASVAATSPTQIHHLPASQQMVVAFPDGLSLAYGFGIRADTTAATAAAPTTGVWAVAIVG
jgi:hypothetical protein